MNVLLRMASLLLHCCHLMFRVCLRFLIRQTYKLRLSREMCLLISIIDHDYSTMAEYTSRFILKLQYFFNRIAPLYCKRPYRLWLTELQFCLELPLLVNVYLENLKFFNSRKFFYRGVSIGIVVSLAWNCLLHHLSLFILI